MAESTLSIPYGKLKSSAGLFLGYGRGSDEGDAAWSSRQSAVLDEIVKSGLRQFYFPMPTDRGGVSHEWSFLRPSTTLVLAAGASSIALPDDFGGFDGRLCVQTDSGAVGVEVPVGSVAQVRNLRAVTPDASGRPLVAGVDPVKGTGFQSGQRFVLEVYPAADVAYTLLCAYHIHPDALTGSRPYAYGGAVHAETIQAAIIAAAELYLDDKRGERWQFFQERLATSVSQDRKMKPQSLGYNGDRSNARHAGLSGRDGYVGVVTVYGNVP